LPCLRAPLCICFGTYVPHTPLLLNHSTKSLLHTLPLLCRCLHQQLHVFIFSFIVALCEVVGSILAGGLSSTELARLPFVLVTIMFCFSLLAALHLLATATVAFSSSWLVATFQCILPFLALGPHSIFLSPWVWRPPPELLYECSLALVFSHLCSKSFFDPS
jgi:hypothetical protein